jgi:4-hydroxy-4-methyl-2-oxoglutarate aldolase
MVTVDLARIRLELGSSVISDMLDAVGLRHQCLAAGLSPLDPDTVIAGYAFPVSIRRVVDVPLAPFRGLVAALDEIESDEVFITPTQRARDIAVWGELLSTACLARGAAGAITDGLVRDTRQVRSLGFPVVSAGTIPYDSMGRHEIDEHRVPCVIDGVQIEPGDLVVADADGVVVVPRTRMVGIVDAAFSKRSSELMFRRAVADGMPASEAFRSFGVL